VKKPGPIPEVMEYFREEIGPGVRQDQICVIGDRLLTDVVFGNRQGMLTVWTQVLTEKGDNRAALLARRIEGRLRKVLHSRLGVRAPAHFLYP
jgi:phosphatidylglycerophosphatase GEP4